MAPCPPCSAAAAPPALRQLRRRVLQLVLDDLRPLFLMPSWRDVSPAHPALPALLRLAVGELRYLSSAPRGQAWVEGDINVVLELVGRVERHAVAAVEEGRVVLGPALAALPPEVLQRSAALQRLLQASRAKPPQQPATPRRSGGRTAQGEAPAHLRPVRAGRAGNEALQPLPRGLVLWGALPAPELAGECSRRKPSPALRQPPAFGVERLLALMEPPLLAVQAHKLDCLPAVQPGG